MAKIDDIVKAIDNKLLETGKEHLILQQASKLLLSLGIIESTKELKQILERGEIPHAYKTNTSPRQWLLPLSEEGRSRKATLKKKKSKNAPKTTKTKKVVQEQNQSQISDQPTLCCPFCGYTGIIPEQFRSEQYLICPCCHSRLDNPLWIERDRAINKKIKKISFILVIVISVIYVVFDDGSSSFDEIPVTNSGLDASVYQVEQFLDDNLNDPDSYDPIEWSAVQPTKNGYYVRHKYRARNGFGGMNIENKIFYLDKDGNVTGYTDY